ncbi:hypothetical protein Tco_0671322 [Tanacetum coccineum]
MVPRVVLMKSGLVSVNTARQNISKTAVSINIARQVNTAHSKTTVNVARPMSYLSKTTHSIAKRPINKNTAFKNSNINQRVNTVRGKEVNTTRPKAVSALPEFLTWNDLHAGRKEISPYTIYNYRYAEQEAPGSDRQRQLEWEWRGGDDKSGGNEDVGGDEEI